MSAGDAQIWRCGPSDAPLIAEVARSTFVETYGEQTSPDDMQEHLAHAYSPEQIAGELAERDSAFFLAMVGDAVAGYLKINRGDAQSELKGASGLEVESLYVLSTFQGQGVGRLLLETAFDEARTGRAEYVWLGVWERNLPARRFWRRMGFVEFGRHAFQFGRVSHTDLTMRRELNGGSTNRSVNP